VTQGGENESQQVHPSHPFVIEQQPGGFRSCLTSSSPAGTKRVNISHHHHPFSRSSPSAPRIPEQRSAGEPRASSSLSPSICSAAASSGSRPRPALFFPIWRSRRAPALSDRLRRGGAGSASLRRGALDLLRRSDRIPGLGSPFSSGSHPDLGIVVPPAGACGSRLLPGRVRSVAGGDPSLRFYDRDLSVCLVRRWSVEERRRWGSRSGSSSAGCSPRRRCGSSWSVSTPPVKLPSCTSSSSARSSPPSPPSVSPCPSHLPSCMLCGLSFRSCVGFVLGCLLFRLWIYWTCI
jgi:hypothetical protein